MQIILNGDSKTLDTPCSVADLLAQLDLSGQRLAVEINQDVVPRSTFAEHALQEGDQVEIVRAIGGG